MFCRDPLESPKSPARVVRRSDQHHRFDVSFGGGLDEQLGFVVRPANDGRQRLDRCFRHALTNQFPARAFVKIRISFFPIVPAALQTVVGQQYFRRRSFAVKRCRLGGSFEVSIGTAEH
jgi:hypothetical protein